LAPGISAVQDIIAGAATAAFIWIAAFMALEGTKADFLVKPIQNAVTGFGTTVAKLPLYIPFLPYGNEKVGIGALAAGGGLAGGLQSTIDKEKSRYADIFGNKSLKNLTNLKETKNAKEAKPAIAKMIVDDNYKLSKESQAEIAEKLKKYNLTQGLVLPSRFKGNAGDFLKALELGQINPDEFREFLAKNKDYKVPMEDLKPTLQNADKAVQAAKANPKLPLEELNNATQKLDQARKELQEAEKISEISKINQLKPEVEKLTAEVSKLTKVRDNLANIALAPNYVSADNKIKDSNQLDSLKKAYEEAKNLLGETKAKESLIKKIQISLPNKGSTEVNTLADNIINNRLASSTPPAAPGAPPAPPSP
jgi:hypothetical protein